MKKIITYLLVIAIVLTMSGCTNTKQETTDAQKFKEEYESLNGEKTESGKEYRVLSIAEDNPFVYSDAEEIVEKIENEESFIVFFAFKECPWCRSIVEQLIKAAADKDVDTIYYVNVKDIRDTKEIDEDGNITTTKEGTEAYMKLIDLLGDVLDDYTLTNEDDEKVSVGEKRIYAPNIVAVSKGKAVQLETGISEELTDPYGELTDSVKKYAYNQFKCLIECLEESSTTCKKDMC